MAATLPEKIVVWVDHPVLSNPTEGNSVWFKNLVNATGTNVTNGMTISLIPESRQTVTIITTPRDSGAVVTNSTDATQSWKLGPDGIFKLGELGHADLIIARGSLLFTRRASLRQLLIQLESPVAKALGQGTEYAVEVTPEKTRFTLFEGILKLSPQGTSSWELPPLTNRLDHSPIQYEVDAGGPRLVANQLVQWWLYYPAVLVPDEFPHPLQTNTAFAASFAAYRRGNVQEAWRTAPTNLPPDLPGAREYLAGLNLAAGNPEQALELIRAPDVDAHLTNALWMLLTAITSTDLAAVPERNTASEKLAATYWLQAEAGHDLGAALKMARDLMKTNHSVLAAARVAQLEFASGNLVAARSACQAAHHFAADVTNASLSATEGFLAAAAGDQAGAIRLFDQALQADPQLGDAWLGRGLVRYRSGDVTGGLGDVRMAARRQRDRALFRAYLGRLLMLEGGGAQGAEELALAIDLDPLEPTGWWFSALENYRTNRFSVAVVQMEQAADRSNNRAVNRSRRLLETDRAVRSAGMANVYQKAGLNERALQAAARAVTTDPASPSAHLFLAESYNASRDPTRFQHRYDTLWLGEFMLANILSPVGAGPLSFNLGNEEYSRLLDRDGVRLSSWTEARSDGKIREVVSESAVFGATSYALDLDWQHDEPRSYRDRLDRWEAYAQAKQQFGDADTVMFLIALLVSP